MQLVSVAPKPDDYPVRACAIFPYITYLSIDPVLKIMVYLNGSDNAKLMNTHRHFTRIAIQGNIWRLLYLRSLRLGESTFFQKAHWKTFKRYSRTSRGLVETVTDSGQVKRNLGDPSCCSNDEIIGLRLVSCITELPDGQIAVKNGDSLTIETRKVHVYLYDSNGSLRNDFVGSTKPSACLSYLKWTFHHALSWWTRIPL